MSGPTFPRFLEDLRDSHCFALAGEAARAAAAAVLAPQPDLVPGHRVVTEVKRDGLVFQRLAIGFPLTGEAEAFFLRPEGEGPFPAVLLLHDHGSRFDIGKEKMIPPYDRSGEVAQDWFDRFYGGRATGHWLARQGYAVLAVDALGWGGRSVGDYGNQQALAANLMQFGLSWAGVIAAEDNWSANLLARLPAVDGERMGAIGLSMGAFRCWQLAAVSPRIRISASICWMARMQALMVDGNNQLRGQSAYAMLHPQLAGRMDYPEIAALAAPKPAIFISGREDSLFPHTGIQAAFEALQLAWSKVEAPDVITTLLRPGGHAFTLDDQALVIEKFNATLKPSQPASARDL